MLHDVDGLEKGIQDYLDIQAGIVKKKQLDAVGIGIITDIFPKISTFMPIWIRM